MRTDAEVPGRRSHRRKGRVQPHIRVIVEYADITWAYDHAVRALPEDASRSPSGLPHEARGDDDKDTFKLIIYSPVPYGRHYINVYIRWYL